MPKSEPDAVTVPATEWDKTPMQYVEQPATDEDGNPIHAGKSGAKSGGAADTKEK